MQPVIEVVGLRLQGVGGSNRKKLHMGGISLLFLTLRRGAV